MEKRVFRKFIRMLGLIQRGTGMAKDSLREVLIRLLYEQQFKICTVGEALTSPSAYTDRSFLRFENMVVYQLRSVGEGAVKALN